jgi:hypothetical protein
MSRCGGFNVRGIPKVEIVMAIEILKEFSGFVQDSTAQPLWSEGLGRQYWTHCKGGLCTLSSKWKASNAFLNFLSYSESLAKLSVTDISLVFPKSGLRLEALTVARRITKGLGKAGKDPNKPYDFFCTNCTNGDSPEWLTDWLGSLGKDDFGNSSYSSSPDHKMQVVFRGGAKPRFVVFLTPNQRDDLCGNHLCFDPNLPEPKWLNEP